METIAVANQKGGVGKTTTAFHLAVALAHRGYRVLAVDLDPQAHLTLACRWQPSNLTSYEVLSGLVDAELAIQHSVHGIDLIGADQLLVRFEDEGKVGNLADMNALSTALAKVSEHYAYCIVDTPPTLDLLSCNGLLAAQAGILVPTVPEAYAVKGLQRLLATVDEISMINPRVGIHSVLPTMVRNKWASHRKVLLALPEMLGRDIPIAPLIPNHGAIAIASALRTSVFACAPKTSVAGAYLGLAEFVVEGREVLDHAG